jgi:hypothetical protein
MTALRVSWLTENGGHRILISVEGVEFQTPPVEHLAFYAGLGALAAAGVIEWPIAVMFSAGHVLMEMTHRPGLQALGEALEES